MSEPLRSEIASRRVWLTQSHVNLFLRPTEQPFQRLQVLDKFPGDPAISALGSKDRQRIKSRVSRRSKKDPTYNYAEQYFEQ